MSAKHEPGRDGTAGGGAVRLALPAALLLAALATASGVMGLSRQEPDFPHREHARLFPLCTGCHQGVPQGDAAAFYPDAALCGRCHDGRELDRVEWQRPERPPDNLRFAHPDHEARTAEEGERVACTDCHTRSGEPRMAVEGVRPERCLACHAHEAEDHYADASCATCHAPLAETRFSRSRIEGLPVPESHRREDFLRVGHAEAAGASTTSCATCHTRERCTSCHVDARGVEAIAGLPRAPDGMELPAFEAEYFTPESHRRAGWLERHGSRAAVAECSTCHTRQDCATCHVEDQPDVVGKLADRSSVRAPGAGTSRRQPGSHDSPFFAKEHGTLAATSSSCTSCHAPSSCTECHASETGSSFHPPDFVAQHASQAYGARMECSNCHNTATFCRDCHRQVGMGSEGRLGGDFHDGQRFWLLRHGQAARQTLESCASCHRQTDCLQCHSTVGAFRVNPHGPGFDAQRFADRNREICFACHLDDPLDGRNP